MGHRSLLTAPRPRQTTVIARPENLGLENWRQYPNSQWSFQHVRQLIPTAEIKCGQQTRSAPANNRQDFQAEVVTGPAGSCTLSQLLEWSKTDGLLILHHGKTVCEWTAPHFDTRNPHILFSCSKSVTAMLAGILENQGVIDSRHPVIRYLPEARNSAYGNCTLRHVLDMSVALDFEENYTDPESEYIQYRVATGWNPVNQENPGPALEEFLYTLKQSNEEHGHAFLYRSPNTDLLGLTLERAAGAPVAELFSELIWRPMGAQSDGYITLDRCGLGRTAGGICVTLADFARLGHLMLDNRGPDGDEIIPSRWIKDTFNEGDKGAWDRGNYAHRAPRGKYRSQWYQSGDEDGSINARGIHGQNLYINPTRSVVIARFASHPAPLNDAVSNACFGAFDQIAKMLA